MGQILGDLCFLSRQSCLSSYLFDSEIAARFEQFGLPVRLPVRLLVRLPVQQ
jgi:hypothetical protein